MSFAGLSQAQECTVLEDFSGSKSNSFPAGWKPREEAGKNVYVLAKDGDMFFVRARATDGKSSGNGSEADRPVKWNIEEYPILSWKWRPRVFPRGGEEQNGKDDSVLGVYVGFCPPDDVTVCERAVKGQLGLSDRISLSRLYLTKGAGSLKYIWSEQLSKGLEFERGGKAVKVLEHEIEYDPAMFDLTKAGVQARSLKKDLGFAGFRLHFHTDWIRDVAAFLGASYFRAVGTDMHQYGLSARGLAIDTALDHGEEFPIFTDFWLEQPTEDSNLLTVYAQLDSPSVTGAYRIEIAPGPTTVMEVDAALYPRKPIERVGIAPLTSMYHYGKNDRRLANDWRPEVHAKAENIYVVLEGNVEAIVEGKKYRLGPGEVAFIPPGVRHQAGNCGDKIARVLEIYAPAGEDFHIVDDSENKPQS